MPFPDLTLRDGGIMHAEATGVADNGLNTFALPFVDAGIDPSDIDEEWLDVDVFPAGAGMTASALGSPLLNPAKTAMTLDFTTDGVTSARVVVQLKHTGVR
jgi:hypothetical protein